MIVYSIKKSLSVKYMGLEDVFSRILIRIISKHHTSNTYLASLQGIC